MSVLDRYVVRAILSSVLLVMLVVLVLGALFVFIDQQDDIGTGHYTALGAFWYTLLNMPQLAYELLPITALIGSLLGLGSLARGSELTVVRASGVSIVRLAGIALLAGLLLILVELLLGEVLAPPLQQAAREQKAFSKLSNVSFGGGGGAWVRDGDLILNVAGQYSQRQFGSMQIFELSPQHRLIALGHATRATAGSLRSAGAGTRMMLGLILGIGFFLLQRLIESGTIVFDLNPVVLAWLPTALLATVTVGLLARAR